MEQFTAKWFTLYYALLGLVLLITGLLLLLNTDRAGKYLRAHAEKEHPPAHIRTVLKYFFFFTLPCLVFAFIPFSWAELLFGIWSLIIIYSVGIQLVRWPQTRTTIKDHPRQARRMVKTAGAMMVAVSPVMFLLCYLVIQRLL